MGEMVPSTLLYDQASILLKDLKEAHAEGLAKDTSVLIEQLASLLTRFEEWAGKPLVYYEGVVETEPPLSDKSNRFWRAAERDINILQQQVDILRAATVFSHNVVVTELMHATNQNARVEGKLKTLQMYSNSHDHEDIIVFGDSFKSLEFTDFNLIPVAERPHLHPGGQITLGQQGDMVNLSAGAKIQILEGSNGFLGNNQEIIDAPQDSSDQLYTFKAELHEYDNLEAITDDEPDTWIEYESYALTDEQRRSARNKNFTYIKSNEDGTTELIDWATPPDGGALRLGFEFDFERIRNFNVIELTPFGLDENINHPILIRHIQTSPNGIDWTRVFPTNVWVGTDVNLQVARIADNVLAHKAIWAFESRAARYARVYIEQHHPVDSDIGQTYWVNLNSGEQVEGPTPPLEDPTYYHDRLVVGGDEQRRELLHGKRWAIGIRDVVVKQVQYVERSVVVSKLMRVGGIIDRVVLEEAEIIVPPEYPSDEPWVRFYVSPDDGETWIPISRIEDTFNGIPEQVSFNDPLPNALRERSVQNHNTDRTVTTLRFKAELMRPSDKRGTTPILRSYRLKVRRR